MPQIQVPSNLSNLQTIEDLQRFLSAFASQLTSYFNGNIEFVKNIKASGIHTVNFLTTTDPVTVEHGLGSVPKGFLTVGLNTPAIVYGTGTWTTTQIYLQSSAVAQALIYII